MSADGPLVLGIETSCDETGVGIVRGTSCWRTRSPRASSEHARFGGVVPEVASRAHLEAMLPTLRRAPAGPRRSISPRSTRIAVTAGPGLMGALVVGVAAAKALAFALDKPLYGVNHLVGHVAVDLLEHGADCRAPMRRAARLRRPHLTALGRRHRHVDRRLLGATIDDAAGEAFDKVARLLGLPYPGGPHIDRARDRRSDGDRASPAASPQPKDLAEHRFDFSFSGLKTAVARWVETRERDGEEVPIADVAARFQEAVVRRAHRPRRSTRAGHRRVDAC